MIRLLLLGALAPAPALAQHAAITPRTMAFEDVRGGDDDFNDVVFRFHGQCDLDGGGDVVRAWIGFTPQAMGANLVNALWIRPAAAVASATLHVGSLPDPTPVALVVGANGAEVLADFGAGFATPASGITNTEVGGPRIDGLPHAVEIVFATPYAGPCDETIAEFAIANPGSPTPIDLDTRVGERPLAGVFPGTWQPPVERTDVADAYAGFLPWVNDVATPPCETQCSGTLWYATPTAGMVDARTPSDILADTVLLAFPACDDGAQNGGETGIDCGDPLGICGACFVPQPDDLVAFVSSQTVVVGTLGTGGSSYDLLDAADDHCQAAAADAGLAGRFVAWLSQGSTEHAKDRLPLGAGPWVRRDGALLGADRADFTDGVLANPLSLDEYGNAYDGYVATATTPSGTGTGLHDCDGGTNTGLMVTVGWSTKATAGDWTEDAYGYCNQSYPIYCFEIPEPKTIFVTTQTYQGNFGGVGAADAICAAEASAGGLSGVYLAWLSDGVVSPASRLRQWGYGYVNGAGVAAASDWADLTDGTVGVELNYQADGDLDVGTAVTWTGTDPAGEPFGNNCSGWTSLSGDGQAGLDAQTSSLWTTWGVTWSCTNYAHLYCVEQ